MSFPLRPLPAPDAGILPALERYAFFAGAREAPFEPQASAFSLSNAAWLADFALLAYRGPAEVEERLSLLGMRVDHFDYGATQAYLCHDETKLVLALRGTEIVGCDALPDILTDLDFDLVDFDGRGRVHRGFARAFERLWPALRERLSALEAAAPARRLWVTGHSLGGALAVLTGARRDTAQGVYTFGCPRVGDARFAERYRAPTQRLVHNNDYVAQLPPALPWYVPKLGGRRHVGALRYLDASGRLHLDAPKMAQRAADGVLGALRLQLENLERFAWLLRHVERPDRVFRIPVDSLRDHAPIYYATALWNELARSGPAA